MHAFISLTADDSQPKIHNKSSRSFSLTVSSREIPSYRNKNKREKKSALDPREVKGEKMLDKTPSPFKISGCQINK